MLQLCWLRTFLISNHSKDKIVTFEILKLGSITSHLASLLGNADLRVCFWIILGTSYLKLFLKKMQRPAGKTAHINNVLSKNGEQKTIK